MKIGQYLAKIWTKVCHVRLGGLKQRNRIRSSYYNGQIHVRLDAESNMLTEHEIIFFIVRYRLPVVRQAAKREIKLTQQAVSKLAEASTTTLSHASGRPPEKCSIASVPTHQIRQHASIAAMIGKCSIQRN